MGSLLRFIGRPLTLDNPLWASQGLWEQEPRALRDMLNGLDNDGALEMSRRGVYSFEPLTDAALIHCPLE